MKTIETANNPAVHAEKLEDIIFEGRNQKYGAYTLRKNYNNHLLFSFLVVFIIGSLIAGIPLLYSFKNPPIIKQPEIKTVTVAPAIINVQLLLPPEPPARRVTNPVSQHLNTNLEPVVTEETLTNEQLAAVDDILDQVGTIVEDPGLFNEPFIPVPDTTVNPNPTYTQVQVTTQAKFKNGTVENFRKWLARNIYYPQDALNNDIKGTVLLKFAIDKFGKICDITIVRGLDPIIDQAAINTLKTSPNWTAATIAGQPVKVAYYLPIAFNIQR